ncbi:hypothetical protein D3C83_38440 [compost metagenome]
MAAAPAPAPASFASTSRCGPLTDTAPVTAWPSAFDGVTRSFGAWNDAVNASRSNVPFACSVTLSAVYSFLMPSAPTLPENLRSSPFSVS